MPNAKAYSAASATSPLTPDTIQRREPTKRDVAIEILYCGICHSDLHAVRNEWESVMPTVYPIVPGHEIVGRVTQVGSGVDDFKEGDLVGVGCLVDSDQRGVDLLSRNAEALERDPPRITPPKARFALPLRTDRPMLAFSPLASAIRSVKIRL